MIQQRVSDAPSIQADALQLPFPNGAFDASLAVLTIHHWKDWKLGVRELARVSSKRTVILTWFASAGEFWLHKYFPELLYADTGKFPTDVEFAEILGPVEIIPVPIPHDCQDGFVGAYWRRPHEYLNQTVLDGMSTFHFLQSVDVGIAALREALVDGSWHREFGHLMTRSELDLGYRLVVADKAESRFRCGPRQPKHRYSPRRHGES
jgi:SAM-dependent methyltransferase